MNFIIENWTSLSVVAVAVIGFIVYLIWQIKKEGLRQFAIDLIVNAEKAFNYGENQQKFDYVFNIFWSKLPAVLQLVVTKELVKKYIQKIFDSIKIALDYKEGE